MKKGKKNKEEGLSEGSKKERGSTLMLLHILPAPGAYLAGMSKCLNWKHKVFCPGCHIHSHTPTHLGRFRMTNYYVCVCTSPQILECF